MRRVVVTGLGIVCPLGNSVEEAWKNALAGKSGVRKIQSFDASEYSCQIAGEIRDFDSSAYVPAKEARRFDKFVLYGAVAGSQALEDSGLVVTEENAHRIGVAIGSGIGGLVTICENANTLKEKGLTIATAESCTGGMIAQRLTNVSGASEVFGFGFVTYWEQAKAKMIGVDPAAIAKYNVVSAPVAAQMALGAAEAAGADIAVSVTGLAGPNGGDAVRPVGTVYLGAACGETVYVKKLFVSRPDRALVRARAAQAALELALRLAQGKVPADTQALAKSARHDAAALTALDSTFLKG